jgi:hypothetical protein
MLLSAAHLFPRERPAQKLTMLPKKKFPDHKVPALVELPGFLGQLLCFHELGLIESP